MSRGREAFTLGLGCLLLFAHCGGETSEDASEVDPAAVAEARFLEEAATLEQARAALRAGDADQAAEHLQSIVDRQPANASAWMMLGAARRSLEDWEGAADAFWKAADLPQTETRGTYRLAGALVRLGRVDEAAALLTTLAEDARFDLTSLAFDPDFADAIDDPRILALMPTAEAHADPFVEPTEIIHAIDGEAGGDELGWLARRLDDVDGDGVADIVASAPSHGTGGEDAGRVYAFSGRTGARLWVRDGGPGDRLGLGVEAAGDVDGDGVGDVIASAPGGDHVLLLAGDSGQVIRRLEAGQPGELYGRKVAGVGDIDGDGTDDVLIGAPHFDRPDADDVGRAVVVSGRDGSVVTEWVGEEAGDRFGSAVAGRSGDGGLLVVVGAPDAGPGDRGRIYAFADRGPDPAFVFDADASGSELGSHFVSVLDDMDGDSVPEILASDWMDSREGPTSGRAYLLSGADGSRVFTLSGEAEGDGFGIGDASAGDVDGDGVPDLVIGAWQHSSVAASAGKAYLYSGRDGSLLRAWTSSVMGDAFGFDATGLGDVDGDGTLDLMITAAWSSVAGPRSGRIFVVSGALAGVAR